MRSFTLSPLSGLLFPPSQGGETLPILTEHNSNATSFTKPFSTSPGVSLLVTENTVLSCRCQHLSNHPNRVSVKLGEDSRTCPQGSYGLVGETKANKYLTASWEKG